MFAGDPEAETKAGAVSEYLSQHSNFKSHGRCIRRPNLVAQNFGLKLVDIASNQDLHDKIWDLYCGMDVVFGATGICKMFFNSNDEAVIRAQVIQQIIQQPKPMGQR